MRPTKYDGILAAVLLIAALLAGGAFLLFRIVDPPTLLVAIVTIDGTECARLPLGTDTVIQTATGHTIEVKSGTVSVTNAPCPDQICVRHYAVRYAGECIVCLPARLTITVTAEEVSDHET